MERCRKTYLYLALMVLIGTVGPASAQPGYVAIITELNGAAEIAHAHSSSFESAVWGMQLFEGDRVKTLADSKVSLLFANSNLIELGANSMLSISGGNRSRPSRPSIAAAVGEDLSVAVEALTLRRTKDGGLSALGDLRSSGSNPTILAMSPRNSMVESLQPTFVWEVQQEFDVYEVSLFDSDGLVWRRESRGYRLEYPDDEAALDPGRQYFWQVEGRSLLDTQGSERIGFRTLDDGSRARMAEREAALQRTFDSSGSNFEFLMGAFFAKEGLSGAAIASFEAIATRHPDAVFPREILATLYADIGLFDAAREQQQLATELAQ